jgi:hypothetical protein
MKIKIIRDKMTDITWAVVVEDDTVSFYDTRYDNSDYGQFVSRYYTDTLLVSEDDRGIYLDGGVPDWSISPDCYKIIIRWLGENQ